jgi:hypothetical protein
MATSIGEQIVQKAREIISAEAAGIRYSELARRIQEALGANINTINGNIWNLDVRLPEEIYKPARGIFKHTRYRQPDEISESPAIQQPAEEQIAEERFYQPFADWIVNELEECTRAIPLGGNIFRDKWGTPDVIGIRRPRESDIIKPPIEIVSAEIKLDTAGLITAFGQACAYKLFSHRSYIVVPLQSSEADIARLDALGRIFGIGVILFDSGKPSEPAFEIRVRASRDEPDMFYVNKFLKLIEEELFP